MNKKIKKGCYGYISYQRKTVLIRTILFFAISLAVYGLGIYSTGSNKNLLTIVAVLGLLPSCKSAINLVMFLKASGCSEEARAKIAPFDEKLTGFYDMYFTSYQKNFPISHMVLKGNVICAYTESDKCDCAAGEKHLEQMLLQDGYKNMTIKIFNQLGKYIDRLGQLSELDTEENKNRDGIIQMFYSISL
ncbi:MAG: hypothetical protein PUD93_07765 [Lachnospiraceae bacterium]|nr:hypothetical protein [Lachnospiraceae bacterium]